MASSHRVSDAFHHNLTSKIPSPTPHFSQTPPLKTPQNERFWSQTTQRIFYAQFEKKLVDITRGLAVGFNLIRLLIYLLVVLDVGIDRSAIIPRRHIKALFQLNCAGRVDPDRHVRAVVADCRI